MPTSRARFSDRAVLRFMKLIQAIRSTKEPTMPNIHTYCIRPPLCLPSWNSDFRCHSDMGWRNSAGFFFASASLTFLSLASLIFSEAPLKEAPSFNCTYVLKAFGRHGSDMVFIHEECSYSSCHEPIN